MKKYRTYWVAYPRGFYNEYSLFWEWNVCQRELEELQDRGFVRISRKHAFELCAEERRRRKINPSSSGYAPTHIARFSCWWEEADPYSDNVIDTYIIAD